MERDGFWGFIAVIAVLAVAYCWHSWTWYLSWRRTRGQLPMYGQAWASQSGRRLYIIGVETKMGDMSPSVVFTDVNPSTHQISEPYRWPFAVWRKYVDDKRLVLTERSWIQEQS